MFFLESVAVEKVAFFVLVSDNFFLFFFLFFFFFFFQTSVTLNKHSGIITTVSASTAANGCEGFPFSNNKIAASDVIQVAIMTYSGTFGTNGIPTVAVSAIGGGSCTVQVCNAGTGGLSGTLKISFWVLKQS